jgi:hypothetical protein
MSLIVFLKSVRILLLLTAGVLLFYFFVGDWEIDENPTPDEEISVQTASKKTQNSDAPYIPQSIRHREVNEPRLSAPQQLSQKKLSQTPLNQSITSSWQEKVYHSVDDPYLLADEFKHTLKSAGPNKYSDLQILGKRAIQDSPALALDLLGQLPSGPDQLAFLEGILSQLLEVSPMEASIWSEQFLDDYMKNTAFGLIGKLYAMQNPEAAANWASEIVSPTLRIKTYEKIALVWGGSDINSAYNWALSLEDYEEQSSVLLNLGVALARDDPSAAANWALSFEDQILGNKILATALNKWSVGKLPDVGQWIAELPESSNKNFAIQHIGSIWAQLNPSAAFEWTETMLNSQSRDLAISTIASVSSKSDPETAASSALAIEDDTLRNKALAKILKNWSAQESLSPARWAESIQNQNLRREVEQLLQQ